MNNWANFIRLFASMMLVGATLSFAIRPGQPNASRPSEFVDQSIASVQSAAIASPPQEDRLEETASELMPWRGPVAPATIEPGTVPLIYEIPTTEPVVFLTIDDGLTKSPETAEWLTKRRLPFSLFLDDQALRGHYGYFAQLKNAGMTVQNHTINHPRLKNMNFDEQKAEICGASDIFAREFGERPTLFRPPYGQFNDDTRRAVTECGLKAIVLWSAVVEKGQMYFQPEKSHLEAGDIVLMHFKPEFKQDIEAFIAQANKDRLKVGKLEDWVK